MNIEKAVWEEDTTETKSFLLPANVPLDFEVIEAQEKTSKSGNEMIELKLRVWGPKGEIRFIYDYLLPAFKYKLVHFCRLAKKDNATELKAEDCVKVSGKVTLKIDDSDLYGQRNSVKDYVVIKEVKNDVKAAMIDDDIPF